MAEVAAASASAKLENTQVAGIFTWRSGGP
jgi:hypothetical protein